jgi:hypothetical protein
MVTSDGRTGDRIDRPGLFITARDEPSRSPGLSIASHSGEVLHFTTSQKAIKDFTGTVPRKVFVRACVKTYTPKEGRNKKTKRTIQVIAHDRHARVAPEPSRQHSAAPVNRSTLPPCTGSTRAKPSKVSGVLTLHSRPVSQTAFQERTAVKEQINAALLIAARPFVRLLPG